MDNDEWDDEAMEGEIIIDIRFEDLKGENYGRMKEQLLISLGSFTLDRTE